MLIRRGVLLINFAKEALLQMFYWILNTSLIKKPKSKYSLNFRLSIENDNETNSLPPILNSNSGTRPRTPIFRLKNWTQTLDS